MLLKQIKDFIEVYGVKEQGLIEVVYDRDILMEIEYTKKSFNSDIEYLQDRIIFNNQDIYNWISEKEIDLCIDGYFVSSYIVG